MEGFFLEVHGKEVSKVESSSVFLLLTLSWGFAILFEKLEFNRGLNLQNNFWTLCLWGWEFHAKPVFFFNIFSGDLHLDVLICGSFRFGYLWARLSEKRVKALHSDLQVARFKP